MDKISELLTRGVANIIPGKTELEELLKSGKKLNIYLGIDPTTTKIHLGHTVPLRKLQILADMGHNVIFLIGDFTALIGDTSDKDSERPSLTKEKIEENFQTYKSQAEKILDFSKISVKHNSEWLSSLNFEEIIKLAQHFSIGDFVGRELVKKRLSENKRVGLHEFLYPVMQGYDSYFMDTDIQLGGTDQTFNMQAGRTLIKDLRNKNSFIIANEFLKGTDGRKMSKTWNNAIWIDDEPFEMYRKIMAINDDQIRNYFILGTNIPMNEIPSDDEIYQRPMDIKKKLANRIVSELHSENDAKKAETEFERTVQKGELPEEEEILEVEAKDGSTFLDVLLSEKFVSSKSDAKRLVDQGGVTLNSNRITDLNSKLENGILRAGKGKFRKIKIVVK